MRSRPPQSRKKQKTDDSPKVPEQEAAGATVSELKIQIANLKNSLEAQRRLTIKPTDLASAPKFGDVPKWRPPFIERTNRRHPTSNQDKDYPS